MGVSLLVIQTICNLLIQADIGPLAEGPSKAVHREMGLFGNNPSPGAQKLYNYGNF